MDEMTAWVTELARTCPEPERFLREADARRGPGAGRGDFLFEVANRLVTIASFKLAEGVLRAALELATTAKDRQAQVRCLGKLGTALRRLGRFDEARDRTEESLQLAREMGDTRAEANALRNIANCNIETGNCPAAIEPCEAAARLFREAGDLSGQAMCHGSLGVALNYMGRTRRSMDEYSKSLAAYEKNGDLNGSSTALAQLGLACFDLGDIGRAIGYLRRALDISLATGNRALEARCREGIGISLAELGDLESGLEYLVQTLAMARESGDRATEAYCCLNISVACSRAGEHGRAVGYLETARVIGQEIGDRATVAFCDSSMAECRLDMEDWVRAFDCGRQALAAATELDLGKCRAQSLMVCGVACLHRGETVEADEYRRRLLAAGEGREGLLKQMRYLGRFGRANTACGRHRQALADFREAVAILEQARMENVPTENRRSFWKDNIGLFDGLVAAEVKLQHHEAAVEAAERGKGRTTHDLMVTRGLEPERFKPAPLSYSEIQELARRLDKTLVMFRVTDRGTVVFTVDAGGELGLTEVPDFTSRRLAELVLQLKGDKPKGGWFGTYSEYKRAQDEAGRLMADGRPHEASALLRSSQENWFSTMESTLAALSEELMAPVFEKVAGLGTRSESSDDSVMSRGGGRVVLVPNRALNILPLHACSRTVEGRKRYLLEDCEIAYAPNCNILDLCQKRDEGMKGERDRAGQHSLFAVANPSPPYELVFSEWEVDEIAKHFSRKEVLVKAEAKQALLERGRHAGVIHLSTHGIHDIGSSFNSRLKLGKDEELTLEEVFEHLRLEKNWLVCLSACESGLLDYRDIADEFIGLQAGFLYAGAPTVIASLWSIADYTTALVMMKLYENIYLNKMTKAAALRSAQLWLKDLTAGEALNLLKAKEEVLEYSERMAREDITPVRRAISLHDPGSRPFSHPYFWAGYQLFGV